MYLTQKEKVIVDTEKHILNSKSIWNTVTVETELFIFDGEKPKE